MKTNKKTVQRFCAGVLALLLAASLIIPAFAAESALTTLATDQDLKVVFTFETEIVPITFISPSGEEYEGSDSDVYYGEGDLTATYIIYGAEAGTWSVEYDLGENTSISYVVQENDVDLWIQSFSCYTEEGTIYYDFTVGSGDSGLSYEYSIYAVNADSNAFIALVDGTAVSGDVISDCVTPTLLSDGNYYVEIDVYYTSGGGEVYDSAVSDVISFVRAEITEENDAEEDAEETESEASETESGETSEDTDEGTEETVETEETEDAEPEEEENALFAWMRENPVLPSLLVGIAAFLAAWIFLKRFPY